MTGIEDSDEQTGLQQDVDQAIEEALELEFVTFEEVKEAFQS